MKNVETKIEMVRGAILSAAAMAMVFGMVVLFVCRIGA